MKKTIHYFLSGAIVSAIFTLAACSSKDDKLPQIDGYNNSDEVASTNLVAHWTFDGTNNEAKSSVAPTTFGTVGFEAGAMGQALKLDSGALVYPAIAGINTADALSNWTVSMWVKLNGTKGGTGYFTPLFSLAPETVSDIWPDIFLGAETGRHNAASDTIEWKVLMNTHPVGAAKDQEDNIAQINTNAPPATDAGTGAWFKKTGTWTHVVGSWNATTHKLQIYGNAVSVGAYNTRANTNAEVLAVPNHAIFGSFPAKQIGSFPAGSDVQGWAGLTTASIDDVRIFKSALSDAEVTALFNLGTAGR